MVMADPPETMPIKMTGLDMMVAEMGGRQPKMSESIW
jgi:hypothetical protein